MTPLENRLVLHRFLCREFGYPDLPAMLERLRDAPDETDASGESEYAKALYLNPEKAAIARDRFLEYDAEIAALSQRLRMTPEHGGAGNRTSGWRCCSPNIICAAISTARTSSGRN